MADNYLSLTRNRRLKLTPASITPTNWSSDNTGVDVDNGWVSTKLASGTATITATDGVTSETWQITIVPWEANQVNMELNTTFEKEYIVSKHPTTGALYYSIRNGTGTPSNILYMSTGGNLDNGTQVSTLPNYGAYTTAQIIAAMLITTNGYFIIQLLDSNGTPHIYFTNNLTLDGSSWVRLGSPAYTSLKSGFDYYYDSANGIIYVYSIDYYTGSGSVAPKIYKGTITCADNSHSWATALTLYSRAQYNADNTLSPAAWHGHTISVDSSNGYVYAGTGDANNECNLLVSTDNGANWTVIGVGDKEYCRTLAIWFTTGYMYWSMDSSTYDQCIFRVPRGTTDLTLRETVLKARAGSFWYHLWIEDDLGNDVVILASSSEGVSLDNYPRMWMIKENADSTVDVDEVLLIPYSDYTYRQFEPYAQDSNGYIYGNYRTGVAGTTLTQKYHLVRQGKQLLYNFVDPIFS